MNGCNSLRSRMTIPLCCALLVGCKDSKSAAKDRVLDAVNGRSIMLTSNDCAVLRLSDGYAGVSITTTDFTAHFRITRSTSGEFVRDGVMLAEGVTAKLTNVPVGSTKLWLGDGGQTETSLKLDWQDHTTGIAFAKGTTLDRVDVRKLSFTTNTPVDPNDLMRASGRKP